MIKRNHTWTTLHLAAGAGPLAKAPLLARGPVALLVLRRARDVPLDEGGGAALRVRADLRVDLLDAGVVDDDDTVDGDHDADHAEHQR